MCMQGFDEYMNLVLDEAEEVSMKRKSRKALGAPATWAAPFFWAQLQFCGVNSWSSCAGRILLKGDNITLMQTTYALPPCC